MHTLQFPNRNAQKISLEENKEEKAEQCCSSDHKTNSTKVFHIMQEHNTLIYRVDNRDIVLIQQENSKE